jgi:hypothetical protein
MQYRAATLSFIQQVLLSGNFKILFMKTIIYLCLVSLVLSACPAKEDSVVARFEGELSRHKWALKDINPDLPADWSSFEYLTLDINASSAQQFGLQIFDESGVRRLQIHPFQNTWVRASIPLIHFKQRNTVGADMAAISKRPLPGLWVGFTGSVGPISNIDSLGVEMRLPVGSPTLEIRNVRLTMAPEDSILSPVPVIDEFGQWVSADWPGKAKTLGALKADWEREERELRPGVLNVSKYGGYPGLVARATGFFRVEKIDGKWWFIDPEGHYFFSAGSCVMSSGDAYARVDGREYIFTMPPEELVKNDTRIGRSSFYAWNLYRRFGTDWYEKWMDLTARRMDDWGLNTIGNWSDNNIGTSQGKPYTVQIRGLGFDAAAMGMPDVYAPGYAENIDAIIAQQCAPLRDDPYLLGYFVGNEPPWPVRPQDVVNVILSGKETPLQNALKKHLAGGDTPERRREFVTDTYIRFITIVNEAIKRHDPNHLNLGYRFGGSAPEDIIRASKGFDVFSINVYGYSVNPNVFQRIADIVELPIIIGEFHFGVPERGFAPGLAQVSNQHERGVGYSFYVEQAAAHPSVIGTHWFIWVDQAPTGRFDGENYNIGFVDVTDRPYKELVDAMRETHKRIPEIHSGKIPPTDIRPLVQ